MRASCELALTKSTIVTEYLPDTLKIKQNKRSIWTKERERQLQQAKVYIVNLGHGSWREMEEGR